MKTAFTILFSLYMANTIAQTEIPLYKGKIPKSKDCPAENKTQKLLCHKDDQLLATNAWFYWASFH